MNQRVIEITDKDMRAFIEFLRMYGCSHRVPPEKMYGLLCGAMETFQECYGFSFPTPAKEHVQ